jgi:hypothetical protein
MYDEVILDKAVQLAAKNGWDGDIERSGYAPLVFNKDFAKALWGESRKVALAGELREVTNNGWQYHLQQMVIAPDPIKYLSDNMP